MAEKIVIQGVPVEIGERSLSDVAMLTLAYLEEQAGRNGRDPGEVGTEND